MTQSSPSVPIPSGPQGRWGAEIGTSLQPGETVLAGLDLDLDARLHFTQGWLVVTDRRLIARAPGEKNTVDWEITPALTLAHSDHAGVGSLELADGRARLGSWRYTLGYNPDALRLAD